MKKNDVKVGGVYSAKITDRPVPVRIEREHPDGGWEATNLKSKRTVRIKAATKLRAEVAGPQDSTTATTAATPAKEGKKANGKATKATKATGAKPRGQGTERVSALDAAAKVLKNAKKPMRCKEMIEAMLADGSWTTKGKTPAATLSAAIGREIKAKGTKARFTKVGRGEFALNG
jgi:hypothetical protein